MGKREKLTGYEERFVPEKINSNYELSKVLYRYSFASKFANGKNCLDIASGSGFGSNYLINNGAKSVIGADISKDAVNYAKEKYDEGKILYFICTDATMLPFCDDFFDIIVSFETIEHIKQYKKFLSECKRVLKKGGLFIVSTPNKNFSSPLRKNPWNPYHIKEFYPAEFHKLLKGYFQDVKMYGQRYIYIINPFYLVSKWFFAVIPFGDEMKKYYKKLYNRFWFIHTQRIKTNQAVKKKILDNSCNIIPYRKMLLSIPEHIVCVCKK